MPIRQRLEFEDIQGVRVGRLNSGINTTFILYRVGTTLVDAGPSNQWPAVRQFVDEQPPRRLLLTHHHEDHSGNAARLAKRFELKPLAPELSRAKLDRGFRTPPIQKFAWGSPIPVDTDPLPQRIEMDEGGALVPILTPGHAKDHTCLLWPERGYLFTGDLFLSQRLTHMRGDENLQQIMESIRKMLEYEFEVIFCSHRGIVQDGPMALAKKLSYLEKLCRDARELHQQGIEEPEAVRRLLGPEDVFAKLSFYNISKRNLFRQALLVSHTSQGSPPFLVRTLPPDRA